MSNNMKEKLLEQAKQEYSEKTRMIFMMFLAPVFLFLLPYIFITLGARLDLWLKWMAIRYEPVNLVLGLLMIAVGWLLAMWSIYSQFTIGRGTPVPLMATKKLIVQPPFTYCRNPMSLGSFIMYLGVAVVFGSIGAAILVLLFAVLLLVYIKTFEEKEMEARFGQEYLDYRQKTPFLVPRFWKR